ncbi:P-loop ATPase, Sll1717 family [Tabrizicola oligotrophica]|uniref:Uncharacterized protein n=1 Tax=Tabrizicola oligotrophica TaxID=2710650 RepID=A0A6M0QUL0_9RHOB|nr:hypothetical protein [Tabrizicola oligotrophica]NEY91115.1 hypothetical protein [Tabrizicola oligotrophica]
MKKFSDYVFGDYSGMREYRRDPDFFVKSFVQPDGFSLDNLSNKSNFIIVGRKGTGKSSCCLKIAHERKFEGVTSTFYSFSEDFGRPDIRDAVVTQALNLEDLSSGKLFDSVKDFYDFKELWIRRVLHSISSDLHQRGINSNFVRFCQSVELSERSIAQGIGRGLTLPPPPDFGIPWLRDVLSNYKDKKIMPLKDFNNSCLRLFAESHQNYRHVFFFDELNISQVDTKSDQYDVLLALVRDIVRASAILNDFFVEKKIDVSVICCLRPEVRNRLIERDPELSKTIDSNSVDLSWPYRNDFENPLIGLLKGKIKAAGATEEEVESIVPTRVKDMDGPGDIAFPMFFLNLTWYRPRDVIRVLKAYQATNGSSTSLFADGYDMDKFLREYSRVSKTDCFAELEVKYTPALLNLAISKIRWARYDKGAGALIDDLSVLQNRLDIDEFIKDLFEAGVIANHQKDGKQYQIYSAARGDSYLNPNIRILVHRGLWRALQLA